jgi:hypothetical protein
MQQALKQIFISLLAQITTQWPASKSRYAGVPPPEMGVGFAIEYSMRCSNLVGPRQSKHPQDKCCRTMMMMMMMMHSTHVYLEGFSTTLCQLGFFFY